MCFVILYQIWKSYNAFHFILFLLHLHPISVIFNLNYYFVIIYIFLIQNPFLLKLFIFTQIQINFFNPTFVAEENFLPWFKTIISVNFKLIQRIIFLFNFLTLLILAFSSHFQKIRIGGCIYVIYTYIDVLNKTFLPMQLCITYMSRTLLDNNYL